MQNSHNFKAFSFIFSGLILLQAVLFLKMGAMSLVLLSVVIFLILVVNLVGLKTYGDRLAGYVLNLSAMVYIAGLCHKTGGFYSISIFMLVFIPLFVSVFANRKDQVIHLFFAVAVFLVFYGAQRFNGVFILSDTWVNISYFRFFNLLILLMAFSSALLIFSASAEKQARLLEQTRQECRQISNDAKASIKVKDEFLANMSHEIRNPMNAIIGMMFVLLDSDLDEEQRTYSTIVYNSSRALLTIVNDILDLSKIQADQLDLDVRAFDLDLAIKDIVALPELQARQKGIDFSYAIDPNVPCLLKGDIGRIRQVINNLTGNAIKFTQAGEVMLNIRLKSDDDTHVLLYFCVEDTGIGIRDDQITNLFDSFVQADLSITKEYGGTGLGLAIAKLLVEKMGGQIGAESIEMVGSTFWFTLRLEKQSERERVVKVSPQRIDTCKVLVLSDGANLGKNFETMLDALNVSYDQAFDDTEAMEMLKWAVDENTPFHIVICEAKEVDMPFETLGKKIRHDPLIQNTKLILLTSIGKKGDARRFEKIGFSAFLSKPVERKVFSDCIQTVLSRSGSEPDHNLPIITRYSLLENKKQLRKILIVEDMETNRLTARALIKKLGYQTDVAENGLEAVQKHKDHCYDLILMDCQMPVMDGFQATLKIRENENRLERGHVPIIAMTGNAFERDREKCRQAGMDDFMSKPVEPEILARKISLNFMEVKNPSQKASARDMADDPTHTRENASQPDGPKGDGAGMCFNKARLLERFGDDPDLVATVLDAFFEDAMGVMETLAAAHDKKDRKTLLSALHALKGAAANVDAELLKNAALDMEKEIKNQNPDSSASRFEAVQREYNRFVRKANL